jgi:hypothetical protein
MILGVCIAAQRHFRNKVLMINPFFASTAYCMKAKSKNPSFGSDCDCNEKTLKRNFDH